MVLQKNSGGEGGNSEGGQTTPTDDEDTGGTPSATKGGLFSMFKRGEKKKKFKLKKTK